MKRAESSRRNSWTRSRKALYRKFSATTQTRSIEYRRTFSCCPRFRAATPGAKIYPGWIWPSGRSVVKVFLCLHIRKYCATTVCFEVSKVIAHCRHTLQICLLQFLKTGCYLNKDGIAGGRRVKRHHEELNALPDVRKIRTLESRIAELEALLREHQRWPLNFSAYLRCTKDAESSRI